MDSVTPAVSTLKKLAILEPDLIGGIEFGHDGYLYIAMGDNKNAYPGGQNSCRLHLDGVVRNATLEIVEGGKGGYIVRDGQWDV